MSAPAVVADVFALFVMAIGFAMLFRQNDLRGLWTRYRGRPADPTDAPRGKREDDPVHYALSIFGMMLLAFGITIFGFVTAYALLT